MVVILGGGGSGATIATAVGPAEVSLSLFGPYVLAVELASFLLLAGLVGASYLGAGVRTTGRER